MSDKSGVGTLGVALAFVGGAAAGAITAILLAPKSGKETRTELRELASHGAEQMSRLPGAIKEAYSHGADSAKDSFAESYRSGDNARVTSST